MHAFHWVMPILLVLAVSCTAGSSDPAPAQPRGDVVNLATLWYSWFGFDLDTGNSIGGLKSSHWNTDVGSYGSRVGITDRPEYGYYASDDPAVIAQQLSDMGQAGIDTIFVSWFGWGDTNFDDAIDSQEGAAMHRAALALLDYISGNNAPFKVAIAVEPFMPDPSGLSLVNKRKIVDFLFDNIYSVYPDLMFQMDGEDLLIHFNPVNLKETADARFTFKQWGSVDAQNWKASTTFDWNGYPDISWLSQQIADDGTLILFARFDEYWAEIMGHTFSYDIRRVDPLLEDGVYEQAWQVAVDNKAAINLLIVYSWNEHGDHSAIEPTEGLTHISAGRILVEKTSEYYRQFLAGESIKTYALATDRP